LFSTNNERWKATYLTKAHNTPEYKKAYADVHHVINKIDLAKQGKLKVLM
jgi:hypothetical protein